METEFRTIPGYEFYAVTCDGAVKSLVRDAELGRWMLNGYLITDMFRGSPTETLPVHRAVALAWVENTDPETNTVVNHKDGNPLNNHHLNLEWCTVSENNYHAVNTGLRSDNIPAKVRDFVSGKVSEFSSIAQAAEFMEMSKDTPIYMLRPKKFGTLLKDRYEFKYAADKTPWFYEGRGLLSKPARYMVEVTKLDGTRQEIFSTPSLLKEYQLYDCPSRVIPELVEFARIKFPDLTFAVRDSYTEERFEIKRGSVSARIGVEARKGNQGMEFTSLTSCAQHFGVDRSSILNRLDKEIDLDGWTFTKLNCLTIQ